MCQKKKMPSNIKKTLQISGIIFTVLVIVGYSLFQAKNLLVGPTFTIETPLDGATLQSEVFTIKGVAHNVASITLNDSPIFIDENGVFEEKLIAPKGYSIIELSVADRFGRRRTEYVHLIQNGESNL